MVIYMNDTEFQKLTVDEKLKYAHEHPTEVIYELTEKGYEYLKNLENNKSNINILEEQNK